MASTLSFSLLIFLSTLSLISSQSSYTLPDHYFINCGSNSNIEFTSKTFIGDDKHADFSFSGGHTAVNNHPTSNTPEIYQSARVFTKKSDYKLEADVTNTFVMVRLHFSPFSANGFDLSNSKFDVSVSGFSLLSNFNAGDSTVIKEFIIPIGSDPKFRIVFTPSSGSSPAFVNAIEAFTTPSELFVHDALTPYVSPFGKIDDVNNISSSYAFKPVYRVNVGGQSIGVDRDTLRRNWTSDDQFISDIEHAETVNPFEGALTHKQDSASSFDAPDDVYRTARELTNSLVNLTWSFEVDKNTMFIVRAHFCDIKSNSLNNSNDAFNFFIYSHYDKVINPGEIVQSVQVPFYMDFVVDSEESGSVNVSIGTIKGISQPAFLNGLEIMELSMNSGVVDGVNDGKSSKKVYIVAGCAVGGLLLVLLIGFCIGLKCRKTKKPVVGAKTGSNAVPSYGRSSYTSISIDFTINNPSPIPNLNLRFQLADILQVTNGFDESLVIGKGGFGKVYKGTFPDGKTVAVKRGEKGHEQGRPEFVTEIMVLSKIRHQHLVTLIGYCDEKSEMILVYEYMEKGTLQDHLYNTNKDDEKLSWDKRLEICISATRGLHYLHTGTDAGIIHRDVKSTNILLNENYAAKVADFGISLLENLEESELAIKGSFGYLDPEYISCMKLTQKSDVYSFGVVLLEVLCARPALDTTLPRKEANLADWAITHIKDGMEEKIIDPYLAGKINPNSLRKYLETAERCLKNTGDERPNMIDVLWDLEYALKLQRMVEDEEPYEDTTMNTSLQLPTLMIDRVPSKCNDDDSWVNDSSVISYPSESQVFSQLKIDEAR